MSMMTEILDTFSPLEEKAPEGSSDRGSAIVGRLANMVPLAELEDLATLRLEGGLSEEQQAMVGFLMARIAECRRAAIRLEGSLEENRIEEGFPRTVAPGWSGEI